MIIAWHKVVLRRQWTPYVNMLSRLQSRMQLWVTLIAVAVILSYPFIVAPLPLCHLLKMWSLLRMG